MPVITNLSQLQASRSSNSDLAGKLSKLSKEFRIGNLNQAQGQDQSASEASDKTTLSSLAQALAKSKDTGKANGAGNSFISAQNAANYLESDRMDADNALSTAEITRNMITIQSGLATQALSLAKGQSPFSLIKS